MALSSDSKKSGSTSGGGQSRACSTLVDETELARLSDTLANVVYSAPGPAPKEAATALTELQQAAQDASGGLRIALSNVTRAVQELISSGPTEATVDRTAAAFESLGREAQSSCKVPRP